MGRASTNLSQCSAGEAHSAGGTLSVARAVPLGEPRAAAGGERAEDHISCRDECHLNLLLLPQAGPVALQLAQLLPQPLIILAALFEHLLHRLGKGCDAPLHSPQQRM